jgi:hypothetical protein
LARSFTQPFLIMLQSVSSSRAVEIVRYAIERHVGRRFRSDQPPTLLDVGRFTEAVGH